MSNRFVGGPAAHNEAVKRAKDAERISERRKRAWRLFTEDNLTFEQIGTRLDVSGKTAWYDVMATYQALQVDGAQTAELLRERQGQNLSRIQRRHMKSIDRPGSVSAVLGAMQREARLYGIDLEKRDSFTGEQVVGLLRGVLALFFATVSDERLAQPGATASALRQEFGLGLKRKVGLIAQDIDVPKRED